MAQRELVERSCLEKSDDLGDDLADLRNVVVIINLLTTPYSVHCYSWHDLRAIVEQPWTEPNDRVRLWRSAAMSSNNVFRLKDGWYDPSTDVLTRYYNTFVVRDSYRAKIGTYYGVSNIHGEEEQINLLQPIHRRIALQLTREGWSVERIVAGLSDRFDPEPEDAIIPELLRLSDGRLYFGIRAEDKPYGYALLWQRGREEQRRVFDGEFITENNDERETVEPLPWRLIVVNGIGYRVSGDGDRLTCVNANDGSACPAAIMQMLREERLIQLYPQGLKGNAITLAYDQANSSFTFTDSNGDEVVEPDLLRKHWYMRIANVYYQCSTTDLRFTTDAAIAEVDYTLVYTLVTRQIVRRRALAEQSRELQPFLQSDDVLVKQLGREFIYLNARGEATHTLDLTAPAYTMLISGGDVQVRVDNLYQVRLFSSEQNVLTPADADAFKAAFISQVSDFTSPRPNSFDLQLGEDTYAISRQTTGWTCIKLRSTDLQCPTVELDRDDLLVKLDGVEYVVELDEDDEHQLQLREAMGDRIIADGGIFAEYYQAQTQGQQFRLQLWPHESDYTELPAFILPGEDPYVLTPGEEQLMLPNLLRATPYLLKWADNTVTVRINADLTYDRSLLPEFFIRLLDEQIDAQRDILAGYQLSAVAFSVEGVDVRYHDSGIPLYFLNGELTTAPDLVRPRYSVMVNGQRVDVLLEASGRAITSNGEAEFITRAIDDQLSVADTYIPGGFLLYQTASRLRYSLVRARSGDWIVLLADRVIERPRLQGEFIMYDNDGEHELELVNGRCNGECPVLLREFLQSQAD